MAMAIVTTDREIESCYSQRGSEQLAGNARFHADMGDQGKQKLKILKATYGSEDCGIDVTEGLQLLVKNGRLSLTVSNHFFTDPCPGKVKVLDFAYELPGNELFYSQQVKENGLLIAHLTGGDRIGIFYTNNSTPPKYLERVLTQIDRAAGNV